MKDQKLLEKRYCNEPYFNKVVSSLLYLIEEGFGYEHIRDALDLAAQFAEERRLATIAQQAKGEICPHCGSGKVLFPKGTIIHSPCFICGRKFDPHNVSGKLHP